MKIERLHGPARVRNRESGQALVLTTFCMVALLAAAGLVVDIGYLYYAYQTVLADTDSAALAAGINIPNGATAAEDAAYAYSGSTAENATYNVAPNLTITNVTATPKCLASTDYGLLSCAAYTYNAISVTETAQVRTFFARLFGIPYWNVSATATASAKGMSLPYHIVMLLDTTASMGTSIDTNCTVPGVSGSPTAEQCAQYGIQQLLAGLDPCTPTYSAMHSGCGTATNGVVSTAFDQVALMVFPGLTPTEETSLTAPPTQAPDAANDFTCPPTSVSTVHYNQNPAYLLLPFQSNYRTSDASTSLNPSSSSNIVAATGSGVDQCGLTTPGGQGTFYAGAIAAATSYLYSNHTAGVQDVLIFLSDGDANATTTEMGGTATNYSTTGECSQAVAAANTAKGSPYDIEIYSVSYGSETSGCTTGETTATTPCQTMESIASTPTTTYFFSVPQVVKGVTSTVCSGARPDTQLDQVFIDIKNQLSTARLIPNGTT